VHGLIPRHRRKAGSGPPATALIAWIGADPQLRSAVDNAASHRRDTRRTRRAYTRSITAAVAACFALTCGAILSIAATMSDGVPGASTTLPLPSQASAATPGQAVSPVPSEEVDPDPSGSSATAPTAMSRQAPRSASGPSANGPADQLTSVHSGQLDSHVAAIATRPPARPASPRRVDTPGDPGALASVVDASELARSGRTAASGRSGDQNAGNTVKPIVPDTIRSPGTQGGVSSPGVAQPSSPTPTVNQKPTSTRRQPVLSSDSSSHSGSTPRQSPATTPDSTSH
jgi:hypothetical protein